MKRPLSDVGNRVIGQWQASMPGPTRGRGQRTSFGAKRRPQSEVLEDALEMQFAIQLIVGYFVGSEGNAAER